MKTEYETSRITGAPIVEPLRAATQYAERLAKDIPAEQFHDMPHPSMNHPAFCYGHLSLYPDKVLRIIGRGDLAVERDGWTELFDAPAPCVVQDGRYPSKDDIMAHYRERNAAVSEHLRDLSEEVLARENPLEGRLREMFSTVGAVVNFMLNSHNMLHLGQVSAWRRAVGLPPVM